MLFVHLPITPLSMKKLLILFFFGLALSACSNEQKSESNSSTDTVTEPFSVLVFSKTAGFRHKSIPAGRDAIFELGKEHGFSVDTTEDASFFSDEKLKKYAAVIFLNTTMDVLDSANQVAFEKYIQSGNGFVGIHSAADTEYNWPWYGKLVGAHFKNHPPGVHEAVVKAIDQSHPATAKVPDYWMRTDEWYNFKDMNPDVHVLCHLDETTYEGGEMGHPHPIVWYHDYDGGRAFYTGMGHTSETFSEPLFRLHLWGGIKYAAGK